MAKASIRLPNGTSVSIEGTTDEVRQLLEFYGQATQPQKEKGKSKTGAARGHTPAVTQEEKGEQPNLAEIINLIKNCDEADVIASQILDRTSRVNRVLLPIYIVHQYLQNAYGLTSGDINRVTTDLGIPISTSNVSHTLSGTASRYVIGHAVRIRGKAIRYKMSRSGVQYLSSVLKGTADDKKD